MATITGITHNEDIPLNPDIFPGLPPGAKLVVTSRIDRHGYVATIPAIGAIIELDAWNKAQAMAELVGKVHALLTRRVKAPLRAGRHDRGWPKA